MVTVLGGEWSKRGISAILRASSSGVAPLGCIIASGTGWFSRVSIAACSGFMTWIVGVGTLKVAKKIERWGVGRV